MAKFDVLLYPEGMAKGLAGYCSEQTAWRFLNDVATALQGRTNGYVGVSPTQVAISDGGFVLLDEKSPTDSQQPPFTAYDAPERHVSKVVTDEACEVWSIGATVFCLVMGSCVMNGRGGLAQKENSKLPYMRQEMPELSRLVQRCLDFNPERRPSLEEIRFTAEQHYALCVEAVRKGLKMKSQTGKSDKKGVGEKHSIWKEEMVE